MATQRRFEADTLAEVLAKVQAEVGSDAKIASAQKVRSGGAFGFFQKERFEVLVDIPDVVAPTPSAPVATTRQAPPAEDRTDWLNSLKPTVTEKDDELTPASLLELAQQINQEERAKEQTVSTESNAFADVLSRMAFQADMRTPPRSTPMPHSPDGSLQSEPEDAATPTPAPVVPQPEPVVAPAVEAVVEHVDEPQTPFIPERPAFLDAAPVVQAPAPAPTPSVAPAPVAPAPVEAVAEAPVPAIREEETPTPVRTRITDHPLAQLGLPAPYIPAHTDNTDIDLRTLLMETLTERLPKIPVIRPSRGSIIAVVGEREEAQRIASDLAREFGRPKEEIVLASQHIKGTPAKKVLGTVESAEDAQRSWSRRQRPTFVAIDARPGTRDTSWAEHVLTALEPIATFGVLEATRKAEDIAAWVDALGGIDCLAINNIEETVSPAAVLQTGIPVERIDGRKATPEYWALLLTERLPAA